ncbi:MAG: FimV/HubP family polar landmark protein [Dokdonella sp.]
MKRPLQLSLAIALALGATNAFALGLGVIQVQSGLNQPLVAEIPIIQGSPGEADGLIVQLASPEDFERVGMNRSTIGVPVEFSIGKNARGEPVIKVTSKEIVREPFLGMLLEANWPKGRLLREYTVLLDPPVMAPAVKGSSAVVVAAKEPERMATQPLPTSKPTPAKPAPIAATQPSAAPPKPTAKPTPAPRAATGNEYGPVAAGETLGEIARSTRPDETISVNQMMLALLKSNPNAFFKENINALKRGAVLRIPSADEIAASGSARDAAAAVRSQIDDWRGTMSSSPTLVADTTSAPSTSASSKSTRTPGERLALVPPREGKADQSSLDNPGGGGRAGGSGDAVSKAEMARVREALTSKEQESGELKSRVKDLEDIKGKNEKLITLQSTELAELRDKLKQLKDDESKAAVAAAAASAASAKVVATPPATTTIVATPPATPATVDKTTADAKVTKDDIWGDGNSGSIKATPGDSTSTAPTAAATPVAPADSGTAATTGSSMAVTTPAAVTEAPKPVPAKPVEVKKPVVTSTPKPASAADSTPWYLDPMVLGAAGVGGLLLVVLGIFGLRKRKPVVSASRTSIANSFGDSPVGVSSGVADAEEQELIAQVQADPNNANAHLELLSLYYAQGAAAKFEAAAEEMYAYVADPNQSSWREVRTMGEELVPHNPLFSQQDSIVDSFPDEIRDESYRFDDAHAHTHAPAEFPHFDDDLDVAAETSTANFETASMPAFDASEYDLGETSPPTPVASSDTSFSFDLPPLEEVSSMSDVKAPIREEVTFEPTPLPDFEMDDDKATVEVPVTEVSDDEFFAGEDAIGTKLDLAKAYLDMGDPEGARSMLEEVLAEGAPPQQDEARKLIAEIG